MKKLLVFVIVASGIWSCNTDDEVPDVSAIPIKVRTLRFEKDFFALDTFHLGECLQQLQQKYPAFIHDFTGNILGLKTSSPDGYPLTAIKKFLKDYRPLKDSAEKIFGNFEKETREITKSLQYLRYYFPRYKTPESIITFIGPIDAFFQTSFGTVGDVITREGLGIGLQLHLGGNSSYYQSALGQELYPAYISGTFTPEHIAVNCIKNIIDDMYEDKSAGKALIEQMIEKGKRLYLLDKMTPDIPDHLKISYTPKQMQDAYRNEALILDFFLSNELMNNSEQNIIKNYIGESPKTQELGEDAPGNLGSFTGWQIVKKFMTKNKGITLEKLMNTDAREIYTSAKYKPR